MAFNKRTWKGRQGTGLNKFSINGASPVTVVNQPDSITEQGDALSAGNMNDLEQRIYDAFGEEATDRENAISALNAEIANNSQRITNIETALSGTVIQDHTDSTQANVKTILSADELLPWAILKRVGARSTQFNQLAYNGNFSDGASSWNGVGMTISASDGVATCTITDVAGNTSIRQYSEERFKIAHKFMVAFEIKPSVTTSNTIVYLSGTASSLSSLTANSWNQIRVVISATGADTEFGIYPDTIGTEISVGDTFDIKNIMISDMTAMNEASLTADQFKAKYPATYYPFTSGSLIDLPPTSFEVVGFNKLDLDSYMQTLGISKVGDYYSAVINPTWIDVDFPINWKPYTRYSFRWTGYVSESATPYIYVQYTDGTAEGFATIGSSSLQTNYGTSASGKTIERAWITYGSGGSETFYLKNLTISIGTDTTKDAPYQKTTIDTSFMAGKKYVNSSCYDYAENVYVNGVLKRKEQTVVGSYTFDGTEAWESTDVGGGIIIYYTPFPVKNTLNVSTDAPLTKHGDLYYWNMASGEYTVENSLFIRDDTWTSTSDAQNAMNGVTFYYELATLPDPIYGDPIPNFPCEDGTTITAITPQTELVNAIDVPSTIGYSTKISA